MMEMHQAKAAFHSLVEPRSDLIDWQNEQREGSPSLAWTSFEQHYSSNTSGAGHNLSDRFPNIQYPPEGDPEDLQI